MVYNMMLSYEDGVWIIISFDYNLIIEGKNKEKVIKKAEKLLKQKIKEEKIDLIDVDIYQIVLN